MMETAARGLEQLIFQFSSLLLYPTLALLVWASLRVLWSLGEAARDAWSIRPGRVRSAGLKLRGLRIAAGESPIPLLERVETDREQLPQVRRFAAQLAREAGRGDPRTLSARTNHLASRFEADLGREVDGVRVLVRLGPALGLAGTLIPLGPGLAALGDGDLDRLSTQLILAFSTTVVGLAIGGVGYVLAVGKAHLADLAGADIELLCELVLSSRPAEGAAAGPEPDRPAVREIDP